VTYALIDPVSDSFNFAISPGRLRSADAEFSVDESDPHAVKNNAKRKQKIILMEVFIPANIFVLLRQHLLSNHQFFEC